MRSSKSRSRSRSNRSNKPSGGNIINRVFDSSGPEGKVRGTPQQIIDKYNQLARDAQLSGDRVATENFQQHAEHYLRLLSEAQKEQESKREEQERQNRERQAQRDRERSERQEREPHNGNDGQPQPQSPSRQSTNPQSANPQSSHPQAAQPQAAPAPTRPQQMLRPPRCPRLRKLRHRLLPNQPRRDPHPVRPGPLTLRMHRNRMSANPMPRSPM
ncbi:DUF4167 domain-containing protein [Phaeobacter sp. J2-8]|uniref:DUF4167 domain-containing protein n=1 Tax=Phaeobacter sp. J2-8 TaxID=2931394 RepID=UPI001FD52216|nr:DUF4167 domain-containing protein [Phaeobacter sp. J2-8]MCJ7873706.1 DUF4167 domain-containing protein [Phaeobacter sp. J2-8]